MPQFISSKFFNVCTDVEGKEMVYEVEPSREEILQAMEEKRQLIAEVRPMTVKYALTNLLKSDLGERSAQGRVPDPHEDKKMELFEILLKIKNFSDIEDQVELTAEEVSILKARAKKAYRVELCGYLTLFLEGKI